MNKGINNSTASARTGNESKEVLRALADSDVFGDFARDFTRMTGLPVSLTPVESWGLAHQSLPGQSPFCSALSQHSPACAACLQAQRMVADQASDSARTVECLHGLCETAVPIRVGERMVGFIRTGQVFRHKPTPESFRRVLNRLAQWGVVSNVGGLRKAYFATRVCPPAWYRSAVGLLHLLARHLSHQSNEIMLRQAHGELPRIARAKQFIETHIDERLTLDRVAREIHTSQFYFCKQFKQATGINFSSYVSRLRVEKAKQMLTNPHQGIAEIAYAAGFASLTHFGRMFKRFAGLSPTAYRVRLNQRCGPPAGQGIRPIAGQARDKQTTHIRSAARLDRADCPVGIIHSAIRIRPDRFEEAEAMPVKVVKVSGDDFSALIRSRTRCRQETLKTVASAPRLFTTIVSEKSL